MKPAAVAFDLYDTLVCHDWASHARFVAGRLGLSEAAVVAAYDELRSHRDDGEGADAAEVLAAVGAHCGVERSRQEWEELARQEAELLAASVEVYDDTVAVLGRLRAEGTKTAIVSNCGPSTRPVVESLGLVELVDLTVLSCEVRASKPAPQIFSLALAGLEVDAERCWFVDDRGDYLDGASALGINTVRIARDRSFGEEVATGHHPVIGSLDEIFALF